MIMKSNNYWKNRANERMVSYIDDADKVADEVSRAYYQASRQLKEDTVRIFSKYKVDGGLSESEARALLNRIPNERLNASLRSTIKDLPKDAQREVLNTINAPAYSARIRNLENLQKDIDSRVSRLARFEYEKSTGFYIDEIGEAHNRALYDLQKGTGYAFKSSGMPEKTIQEILKQNWSGVHYSKRIWGNIRRMTAELKRELLSGFLSGSSYNNVSRKLQERYSVGAMEVRRLIRTETNYMANQAEKYSYVDAGIEQYEYLATLDIRTSTVCQQLDGKCFDIDTAQPGENYPPMHPNCRSTTIAVIGDEEMDGLERRARDPETGRTYKVPANMSYLEWKKHLTLKRL